MSSSTGTELVTGKQAEVILDMFDLTSLEVDRAVREWNDVMSSIPEGWFDNLPAGFAQTHTLAKLQQIATQIVRGRS